MVMPTLGSGAGSQASSADLIKKTTTRDFVADVVEASKNATVLVDFWAPWCGPCKQLTPVLEKAVKEANGSIRLVKMNIDEHPSIAQQMGIQSIPAVFAFKDGKPVDGFMGALPESQIKEFINRVGGDENSGLSELLEAAGTAFQNDDFNAAIDLYGQVVQQENENTEALAGLVKSYIKLGDLDQAEKILLIVPPDAKNSPEIDSAINLLEVARQGTESGNLSELKVSVQNNPDNLEAKFDLSIALNANGDREEALDILLEIIKRDRNWNDEAGRKQLVKFFDAWGATDPLTIQGRRQLSSILFS